MSTDPSPASEIARLTADVARLEESERRLRLGGAHARLHLVLLARGGNALLARPDDEDASLTALAEVVVGAGFADWCAIDRVGDDGGLRRLAALRGPGVPEAPSLETLSGWSAPVRRALGTGRSELAWGLGAEPAHAEDADHLAFMRAMGLDSWVIAPIRIQGLSVGAISCATRPPRRGYRLSDQHVLEELADRAAATVERISLYRETRLGAAEIDRRASQLRRLMTAAVALQPQHSTSAVAEIAAREAVRVLGVTGAVAAVTARDGAPVRSTAGSPGPWPAEQLLADGARLGQGEVITVDGQMAVRLEPSHHQRGGVLAVGARPGGAFTEEDEAILMALAQMATVALDNARLYESVQTGEARLLAMVEAAPVAIFELGLDGSVRRANTAAHVLLGAIGTWSDTPILHDATSALLAQVAADTLAGRPRLELEVVARRSDGEEVTVDLAGALVHSGAGAVDGVLVTATDLTARRRLEEQLVRAQRIEAVGQVAGGVAHDFNNLLTVVLGHAALLNMSIPEGDVLREDVDAIAGAAERAAAITSQLLTLSRGDLVAIEAFDARARLQRLAASTLRSLLPESVGLKLNDGPGEALVRMSPAQFDQVILNLAVNARDAMAGEGTLSIRLYEERGVVIEVADTGAGMTPEVAARCFEPFFSTKGGLRGTGLGLATVQAVITGVGGELELRTAPGQGTTFTVRLPRAVGEADAGAADRPRPEKGSERVLLVEDEAGLRRLAVEVLRGAGYVVIPAVDGAAALEMIEAGEEHPDLVVTDVVMPKLGGVELARRLHEIDPKVPVLFLTGYEDQPGGDDLDGADVLIKPFLVDDLVGRVRAALDR